jgi:hypothetical protein
MQPVPYQDKYDHYAERVKAAGKLIAVRPHYASEKDAATHVSEQLLALNFNYGSVDNTTKPRGMNSITPSQVRRQVNNLLAKHILQDQQKATSSAIAPGQTNTAAATPSHNDVQTRRPAMLRRKRKHDACIRAGLPRHELLTPDNRQAHITKALEAVKHKNSYETEDDLFNHIKGQLGSSREYTFPLFTNSEDFDTRNMIVKGVTDHLLKTNVITIRSCPTLLHPPNKRNIRVDDAKPPPTSLIFQLLPENAMMVASEPGQTNTAAATLSHTVNPGTYSSHSQPETPRYPSGVGPSFTRQAQVVHESRAAQSEPTSTLARINQVVLKSGVARPRLSTRPYARTVVSSPMAQAARPVILVVAAELSRASPDSHIISQQSLVSSSAMLGGHAETGHQGPLYINPALRTTSSSSHADTMGQNQIHGEYMMSGALQEPHIDKKSKRY